MRLVHILLALAGALLLGAWLAPLLGRDPGYVLVRFQGWAFETTATALGVALILVVVVWRVVAWLLRAPRRAARAAVERARRSRLERGLLALAEGRWSRAEKLLTREAKRSDEPAAHYLAAARAARARGDDQAREQYLALADEASDQRDVAAGLTRAELLLEDGDPAAAAAVLEPLREANPKNARVLKALAAAYRELERWSALRALLPALKRAGAVTREEQARMERRAVCGELGKAADMSGLKKLRESLPRRLGRDPVVVHALASRAHALGRGEAAVPWVEAALKQGWDDALVRIYGRLPHADPARALKGTGGWLKAHPDDPALMLTLGRLCRQAELEGKARDYLERSLALESRPETYRELAELLERQGDTAGAMACYRNLVRLRRDEPVEPVQFEDVQRLDAPR